MAVSGDAYSKIQLLVGQTSHAGVGTVQGKFEAITWQE